MMNNPMQEFHCIDDSMMLCNDGVTDGVVDDDPHDSYNWYDDADGDGSIVFYHKDAGCRSWDDHPVYEQQQQLHHQKRQRSLHTWYNVDNSTMGRRRGGDEEEEKEEERDDNDSWEWGSVVESTPLIPKVIVCKPPKLQNNVRDVDVESSMPSSSLLSSPESSKTTTTTSTIVFVGGMTTTTTTTVHADGSTTTTTVTTKASAQHKPNRFLLQCGNAIQYCQNQVILATGHFTKTKNKKSSSRGYNHKAKHQYPRALLHADSIRMRYQRPKFRPLTDDEIIEDIIDMRTCPVRPQLLRRKHSRQRTLEFIMVLK